MILFRKRFVTLAEVRFGGGSSGSYDASAYPGVDIVYFLQNPQPVPGASHLEEARTLLHDLTQEPESLLKAMDKTTRYEIQRAREKDQLAYQSWRAPDPSVIREYCGFFSFFAGMKKIPDMSEGHLRNLSRAGILDLSRIRSAQGATLTWHAHLISDRRSRLLYSASSRINEDKDFRNLVSRANRFHHWEDMLRFRAEGCRLYDFGGWYAGKDDQERLQINQFKERFGGSMEISFNCELPLTWRGKIYLRLRKALKRRS
jgi:hypothetical protein